MSNRKPGSGMFHQDLQRMMYGFGDAANPLPETVALVEDIVVEYITDMVHKAQDVATNRGNLMAEDVLFLIRKDLPKVNRCKELLSLNKIVQQAMKNFKGDKQLEEAVKVFNEEKLVSSD